MILSIKNLKWLSTFFVLTGILFTNLDQYQINIFMQWNKNYGIINFKMNKLEEN